LYTLTALVDETADLVDINFTVPAKPTEYPQLDKGQVDINPKTLSTITGEMEGGRVTISGGAILKSTYSLRILEDAVVWGSISRTGSHADSTTVVLQPDNRQVAVDAVGRFEIPGIEPGRYSMVASTRSDTLSIDVILKRGLNRVHITIE
jgi:hypothetical protein